MEASIFEFSTELGGSTSGRDQRYCGDEEQNILIGKHCEQLKGVEISMVTSDG
jgi:hypothetical protein